jgi:hypothetical protein
MLDEFAEVAMRCKILTPQNSVKIKSEALPGRIAAEMAI